MIVTRLTRREWINDAALPLPSRYGYGWLALILALTLWAGIVAGVLALF